MRDRGLIEREEPAADFDGWLRDAADGSGSLVLVAGEAGVGKSHFVEQAAADRGVRLLRGLPSSAALAYEPVTAAFRSFMRSSPNGLDSCGPLRSHLALLLPELGDAVAESDRATLFEAIRCGLAAVVRAEPACVLLDDLHASDETTLDLLSALAPTLGELPILVVGAYRSDELPRTHPVRRLRNEIRRAGALRELTLDPLSERGTAELAASVLEAPPSQRLAALLHSRTGGIPFFVEELAGALQDDGRLTAAADGLDLELDGDVPVPQTVRDAVLLRAADLPPGARAAAEAAATAGARFESDLLTSLGFEDGLNELLTSGLIKERDQGKAEFRHPLARDAIYEDVPWLRRRALHREIAAALESRDGSRPEVAAHWLAAHDTGRAVDALVRSVDDLAGLHAYRDATRLGKQALELWPEGERGKERIALLERHAQVAGLAGELAEAARAQREVVAARRTESAGRALADAQRNLGAIYELQGDRDRALAARRVAAMAYAANGLPGDAATERLVGAGYLQSAGRHEQAEELAREAAEEAVRAERVDLRARALGLEGVARVKRGQFEVGMETIQTGLSLALEHELTLVAAEVYQRLGTAHEIAGDYGSSRDALSTAVGFCETDGGDGLEYTCLSCLAYVLRELGDWDRSSEMCRELMQPGASPSSTLVADGVLGAILAFRGDGAAGRPLLERCFETSTMIDVVSMGVDSAAALAYLEELEGNADAAAAHCRFLLERWSRSEDHHYAVWGLRWAASFFARAGELTSARECTEALSTIAGRTSHPDAVAALAHALGETALAEGEPQLAAEQLMRAVNMHESLEIPFERAQIELRAGVCLAAAGERDGALEQLTRAHASATALGAAPLASAAAEEVAEIGASIEQTLGRRAAAEHENAGLSRRELEVMRLVASGQTNREIAAELVLSTRTVDMHVRNILTKMRCRSRTEAATKAGELGLLA